MNALRRTFADPQLKGAREAAARHLDWRYQAIYEFLQISPSYWAAHELAKHGKVSLEVLPSDLEIVQSTYERLGSVWETSFHEWWFAKAQYEFGRTAAPQLDVIGRVDRMKVPSAADEAALTQRLKKSLVVQRDIDGLPGTIVLAVPLRGPKKETLKRIADLLQQLEFDSDHVGSFRLVKSKARQSAVVKCLQVVRRRASHPKLPLWNVAGMVNINITRSLRNTVDDKHVLSAHMSRYTKRAYLLAENAARGSFPDETPLPADVATQSFDFAVLNRVYRKQIRSLEKQLSSARVKLNRERQ
jgi:hypothetical protein